jgi:hypothetical protein
MAPAVAITKIRLRRAGCVLVINHSSTIVSQPKISKRVEYIVYLEAVLLPIPKLDRKPVTRTALRNKKRTE